MDKRSNEENNQEESTARKRTRTKRYDSAKVEEALQAVDKLIQQGDLQEARKYWCVLRDTYGYKGRIKEKLEELNKAQVVAHHVEIASPSLPNAPLLFPANQPLSLDDLHIEVAGLIQQGNMVLAQQKLLFIRANFPFDTEAAILLGDAYALSNQKEDAIKQYTDAATVLPFDPIAIQDEAEKHTRQLRLAKGWCNIEKWKESAAVAKGLIEEIENVRSRGQGLNEQYQDIYLKTLSLAAKVCGRLDKWDVAAAYYSKVIAAETDRTPRLQQARNRYHLAMVNRNMFKMESAYRLIKEAVFLSIERTLDTEVINTAYHMDAAIIGLKQSSRISDYNEKSRLVQEAFEFLKEHFNTNPLDKRAIFWRIHACYKAICYSFERAPFEGRTHQYQEFARKWSQIYDMVKPLLNEPDQEFRKDVHVLAAKILKKQRILLDSSEQQMLQIGIEKHLKVVEEIESALAATKPNAEVPMAHRKRKKVELENNGSVYDYLMRLDGFNLPTTFVIGNDTHDLKDIPVAVRWIAMHTYGEHDQAFYAGYVRTLWQMYEYPSTRSLISCLALSICANEKPLSILLHKENTLIPGQNTSGMHNCKHTIRLACAKSIFTREDAATLLHETTHAAALPFDTVFPESRNALTSMLEHMCSYLIARDQSLLQRLPELKEQLKNEEFEAVATFIRANAALLTTWEELRIFGTYTSLFLGYNSGQYEAETPPREKELRVFTNITDELLTRILGKEVLTHGRDIVDPLIAQQNENNAKRFERDEKTGEIRTNNWLKGLLEREKLRSEHVRNYALSRGSDHDLNLMMRNISIEGTTPPTGRQCCRVTSLL